MVQRIIHRIVSTQNSPEKVYFDKFILSKYTKSNKNEKISKFIEICVNYKI